MAKTATAFGPLAPLIPLGFLSTIALRPRYALLSGTAAGITCFFAASYVNADIDRYYLVPVLLAWTWLALLGAAIATVVARNLGEGRRPEPVMAVALAAILLAPTVVDAPTRFPRIDRSHDDGAARWVDMALGEMAPDAVIVSWWSYSTPLWYAQLVQDRRPDIDIIDDRTRLDRNLGEVTDVIDANLPTRPVYVIRIDSAEIAALDARYRLEFLDGPSAIGLTRVLGPRTAS